MVIPFLNGRQINPLSINVIYIQHLLFEIRVLLRLYM